MVYTAVYERIFGKPLYEDGVSGSAILKQSSNTPKLNLWTKITCAPMILLIT